MCGSKGAATSTTTYTPPADVTANYDALAAQAKQVAATPFTPYSGEMVAGLDPTQQAGITNTNAAAQLAQPYYTEATGLVGNAANPFDQNALNTYMSPYLNSVVNATMANLNETNAQQQQQLLGNQIQQGAFGGDRGQIAQAELARQQNLATGQTLANALQGGYSQALGQFNADQTRALQAGSSIGQLGTNAQQSAISGAQAQMAAGATQQANQQAIDTANQQQFQAQQAYPFQTTQYLGNLLLGIGGQSGGTALTSQPQGNIGSSLIGGLLTAGSLFGPSDERLKENMEPVGKTFDGQNIYKYNFKGSPKTEIGLSAQEVEKHTPSAVRKDANGMRMVNYDQATGVAASKGHFANGGLADSMGGGVHEGLGRAGYALAGGVDSQFGIDMPYSDQPVGATPVKLSLADVMRVKHLGRQSPGWSTKPSAHDVQTDGGIDANKVLGQAMSDPYEKGNLQGWVNQFTGRSPGTVSADLLRADGGVVGRHGYEGDGFVTDPGVADYASRLGTLGETIGRSYADLTAPQDPNRAKNYVESIIGHPLSDEANMGLLSAGLAMMGSKSPIFGLGVAEGAQTGLGTYYNALKNKRDYAAKLLEDQEKAYGAAGESQYRASMLPISGTEAGAAMIRAKAEELSTGMKAFDTIKDYYKLGETSDPAYPEGYVVGPNGTKYSFDQYKKIMGTHLKTFVRDPSVIDTLTDPSLLSQPRAGRLAGGKAPEDTSNKILQPMADSSIADDEDANKPVRMAQAAPLSVTDAVPNASSSQTAAPKLDYDKLARDSLDKYNYAKSHPEFPNSAAMAVKAMEDYKTFSALAPSIQAQARDIEGKKQGEIEKSKTYVQRQNAFSDEATNYLKGYAEDENRLKAISKIYQLVETNRFADAKAQAAGVIREFGLDSFGGYDLGSIQSANDTTIKDATIQAMNEVRDKEQSRAPATGLKVAITTVANPKLSPGAKYNLVVGTVAEELRKRQMYQDWFAAGQPDKDKFMAQWQSDPKNGYEDYKTESGTLPGFNQKAADAIPLFKGMTEGEMKLLMAQPKSNLEVAPAAAPAAPVVRKKFNPATGQIE